MLNYFYFSIFSVRVLNVNVNRLMLFHGQTAYSFINEPSFPPGGFIWKQQIVVKHLTQGHLAESGESISESR